MSVAFLERPLCPGRWTGVIELVAPKHDRFRCGILPLSGQSCFVEGLSDEFQDRITVYDVLVNRECMGFVLRIDVSTVVVQRAQLSVDDLHEVKELCSGLACISMGAVPIGGRAIGALDVNRLAISHLEANHHPNPILGSVLKDSDVCRMHLLGGAKRGTLTAGFPCQPFSKQGDKLGMKDSRSMVFEGVARAAWLMQPGLLLLECVTEAGSIPEINSVLATLASGLNFGVRTIELALEDVWPCKRHRWWAVLTIAPWLPAELKSWPSFAFPTVRDVIPEWPVWPEHEEAQLELGGIELQAFHEPSFGGGDRVLQMNGKAPTFLHSYGSQLVACPCKCRSGGLSPARLERAGLRGVYVHSQMSNMPRWLHPKELAVLQTIMPDIVLDDDLRASLVMLGQIAAPAQALWLLSQIWLPLREVNISPEAALKKYLDELLCRRYHVFPPSAIPDRSLMHVWHDQGGELVAVSSVQQVKDFTDAEERLLSDVEVQLWDGRSKLKCTDVLHSAGLSGAYTVVKIEKPRQTAASPLVLVKLISGEKTWQTLLASGSFVFEAFWRLRLQVEPTSLKDDHDGCWFPDSRIWEDVTLLDVPVISSGPLDSGVCLQQPQDEITGPQLQRAIDELMLSPSGPGEVLLTVDQVRVLIQAPIHLPSKVSHRCGQCLVFHGVFQSCGHWAMFSCVRRETSVEVHYFDGVIHLLERELREIGTWAGRLWGLSQVDVLFARTVVQPRPHLSAAVALAHLRQACSLMQAPSPDDLEHWHETLMQPIQSVNTADSDVDMETAVEGLELRAMMRFAEHIAAEATTAVTLVPLQSSVNLGHGNPVDATLFVQSAWPLAAPLVLFVESAHHWLLFVIRLHDDWLDIEYYDGLPHGHDLVVNTVAAWAQETLQARGFVLHYVTGLTQQQHDHCGVIALANFAMIANSDEHWTQEQLTNLHALLQDSWEVSHSVWACGGSEGQAGSLAQQLADLLITKGVPRDRANERALAGIAAVGEAALTAALKQKNPWADLKQLGSKPSTNFQWVKPDELMRQVRARAEEQYGVAASMKKRDGKRAKQETQPLHINPQQLSLIDGSFVDSAGNSVRQIQLADVSNQASGLAFATVNEASPYLQEGKSLSISPLALLTTSPVPHEQVGLLPVQNLRFPVLYQGTQEPVLVQGSLIQLGDEIITRQLERNPPSLEALPTETMRLIVFRDEFEAAGGSWDSMCQGPLKQLFQAVPGLTVCRGAACGGQCPKHHCPVDQEYESLLTDVWERRWSRTDGGAGSSLKMLDSSLCWLELSSRLQTSCKIYQDSMACTLSRDSQMARVRHQDLELSGSTRWASRRRIIRRRQWMVQWPWFDSGIDGGSGSVNLIWQKPLQN